MLRGINIHEKGQKGYGRAGAVTSPHVYKSELKKKRLRGFKKISRWRDSFFEYEQFFFDRGNSSLGFLAESGGFCEFQVASYKEIS